MSVLYLVVPLALLVVGVAVGAFVWAAGRGQFDDLETPAVRMLRDDGEIAHDPVRGSSTRTHTKPAAPARAATAATPTTEQEY